MEIMYDGKSIHGINTHEDFRQIICKLKNYFIKINVFFTLIDK